MRGMVSSDKISRILGRPMLMNYFKKQIRGKFARDFKDCGLLQITVTTTTLEIQ